MNTGKLTICRHGIIDEDYIAIEIADRKSSKQIMNLKISLENFTRAITNLSSVDMEYEVKTENLNKWGKQIEVKEILLPIIEKFNEEEMKIEIERTFVSLQNKGVYGKEWIIKNDGIKTQQNNPKGWKIIICRYIDEKEENKGE